MPTRHTMRVAVITLGLASPLGLYAHAVETQRPAEARHGGYVHSGHQHNYELTIENDKVVLWVYSPGNVPLSTDRAEGRLTLWCSDRSYQLTLVPDGDNRLTAKAEVHEQVRTAALDLKLWGQERSSSFWALGKSAQTASQP